MHNHHDMHHPTESAATPSEGAATHGMLLFGEQTAYLSHLPMFGPPHNFQAILEVRLLSEDGVDLLPAIQDDRRAHPQFKMYSFVPTRDFVLTDLVTFMLDEHEHPQHPVLDSFPGKVYRGHFETWHEHEKSEFKPATPIPELVNVFAQVTNVVLFRELDTYAQAPPLLPQLGYFLFGTAQELFLAHVITQPRNLAEDFDQVLGVQLVDGHQLTDDELRRGMLVTFPERANSEDQKINEQEQVTGDVWLPGQGTPESLTLQFRGGTEFYFETDDLKSIPVHAQEMQM
jgi:hypothetical protein